MILLDLTHTSHSRAQTGIQRVARCLHRELAAQSRPICYDPYEQAWRDLEPWERRNLSATAASPSRSARWPLPTRLRGCLRHLLARLRLKRAPRLPLNGARLCTGLFVPEIFSPRVAGAYAGLFPEVPGKKAAYFFDAIALKYPELAPGSVVARFPSYLQELLRFDAVAAISGESRDALVDYWRWLGAEKMPPVTAIPLGSDLPPPQKEADSARGRAPVVLYVSSVEGRKNHLALVEACESLWQRGLEFELRLIGLPRPETAGPALRRIAALERAGRPLRYAGAVSDGALEQAYAEAVFTVYPSLMEGSGLPVRESLARGKPCICSGRGALGEAAVGGGCLTVDALDVPALAGAIEHLLRSPAAVQALAAAARARPVRTWADVARDLGSWMETN